MLNVFIIAFFLLISESKGDDMFYPKADKMNYTFSVNNQSIVDEYFWLRDTQWPKVNNPKILKYLNDENVYTKNFFDPLKKERELIFQELKSRIKLSDQSAYTKIDNYFYYSKTEEDKEYPIYCRKLYSTDANEEVILDLNNLVEGHKFINVKSIAVSPNHELLAYTVDFVGDERYTLRIYDLKNQKYLEDIITNIDGNIVWDECLNGLFYITLDIHWRQSKVKFHYLGVLNTLDQEIFNLSSNLFRMYLKKSADKKYIFLNVASHNGNEVYFIRILNGNFSTVLIRPFKEDIFYDVEHHEDRFFIRNNYNAKNFKISVVSDKNFKDDLWNNDYVSEESDKYLSGFDISKEYLILNYRVLGLPVIEILKISNNFRKIIKFQDESYCASAICLNYNEDDIRINYSSLARPNTVYSYNYQENSLSILKEQEIPSGFDPNEYKVERIFSDSGGVDVPITVFYKRSLFSRDGSNPLYLYGYGSYGYAVPVSFRNSAISLVNRGFVYAISHVRGGDELGQEWHNSAKFLNKKLTFQDFISSVETLISKKYTSTNNIIISGGSAGGMLVGAAINLKPELFKAAIAHVPFVDVLNTMLDETLPLTPGEFKEWGNPKELEFFNYIKSYSPYDNIKKQSYPHLFVTAGISDPRVGYWEAAKWVARLRAKKLDKNFILLKTNMDSGHQGASGRFDYLKEIADDIVFIMKIFNKID